jgi:hypothetical protein
MAKNKYLINVPPKVWTVAAAWFHVLVGGILTEYIVHHTTSIKALVGAGVAAVVPLVYRYVNPADTFPAANHVLIAADNAVKN